MKEPVVIVDRLSPDRGESDETNFKENLPEKSAESTDTLGDKPEENIQCETPAEPSTSKISPELDDLSNDSKSKDEAGVQVMFLLSFNFFY